MHVEWAAGAMFCTLRVFREPLGNISPIECLKPSSDCKPRKAVRCSEPCCCRLSDTVKIWSTTRSPTSRRARSDYMKNNNAPSVDGATEQQPREARWVWRLVRRLLCPHRWEPVNDWFYGSHSCFDILTKTPRRWKCCDCGKEIVTRHMPVSYVPPNGSDQPPARG